MPAVKVNNVSKRYGKKHVLNNLDLEIGKGMFGLLGPNGAGKSTLMKCMATLECPTTGEIIVKGYDTQKDSISVRKQIGYLPQDFSIYPNMNAWEFLDYMAGLNKLGNGSDRKKRIEYVLEKVNLLDSKKSKVGGFSGGMLRRLGIANAILKDPAVLIVDEPTAGLDPEERIRFRMLLVDISKNKTVILSTHIVEDIESTCSNIGILHRGNIIYTGAPKEFITIADNRVREVKVNNNDDILELSKTYEVISLKHTTAGNYVRVVGDFKDSNEIQSTLEDAYMYYMKYKVKEATQHAI